MPKYNVRWSIRGSVEVEAESHDEARNKFYELADSGHLLWATEENSGYEADEVEELPSQKEVAS